jgi:hypothetical protein
MLAKCYLNTLGRKPFIRKHLLCAYMLKINSMIPDFVFHNIELYVNAFGSIT